MPNQDEPKDDQPKPDDQSKQSEQNQQSEDKESSSQPQEEQIKKIVEQVVRKQMKKNGEDDNLSAQPSSDDDSRIAIDCTNAHNIALQTLNYCLEKGGGKLSDPANLKIIRDCSDVTALANEFVLRQSEFKNDVLALCHEVCETCAKFAKGFEEDEQLKALAQYAGIAAESTRRE